MISLRIGTVIVAAFIAGAFVTSPELRAYAAATIGSADIIDESIQSVDIKNGQVKASDIATDAVTADEIKGVSKLIFAQCAVTSDEGSTSVNAGDFLFKTCTISGVDIDDSAVATLNAGGLCFEAGLAVPKNGNVLVYLRNECASTATVGGNGMIGIIVFDK